jgi:3-hydroxy acid dehydrogenase / malonic semialdehyde reductase
MNRIAFITGATSGIGKATSLLLAKNNFDLIITGRRKNLLDELEATIKKSTNSNVLSLNFDVRKNAEVEKAIDNLQDNWKNIDVLINNAGLAAGLSTIQDGKLDDWERMIDTNIKGLLYVSKKIIPLMIERKTGHIVNISSIAGKDVYINGNVYCATKFAVEALTKGMRAELFTHGIKVTSILPGMVETEFSIVRFDGNTDAAQKVYQGLTPLVAEDIADPILYAITRPAHVCIQDIVLTPVAQANVFYYDRKGN